jgi:uncharacterized protein (TIRG00374 family)
MKKFHAALLLLGFVFLGYLIWTIGARELLNGLVSLGWGLTLFIVLEFTAESLHTIGWSCCLDQRYRDLSWFQRFRIRMAGNAINYLTPTAALGGEATKVTLLASNHRMTGAVSGVLIGRLSTGMAQALFVAIGSAVVFCNANLPRPVWIAMFSSSGFVIVGIVVFLLLQKYGQLGAIVRWLAASRLGGKTLKKLALEINSVDDALKAFHRERPRDLALSVAWQLFGHSTGLVQTWWFFHLLHCPFSASRIATVWVLGLWFDMLTFAVPLNMGTLEGTRIVAFKAIGFSAVTGMTYGIALRLAQLSCVCFGLINYGLFLNVRRAFKTESPTVEETGDYCQTAGGK